jgi:hypothetical protein
MLKQAFSDSYSYSGLTLDHEALVIRYPDNWAYSASGYSWDSVMHCGIWLKKSLVSITKFMPQNKNMHIAHQELHLYNTHCECQGKNSSTA